MCDRNRLLADMDKLYMSFVGGDMIVGRLAPVFHLGLMVSGSGGVRISMFSKWTEEIIIGLLTCYKVPVLLLSIDSNTPG